MIACCLLIYCVCVYFIELFVNYYIGFFVIHCSVIIAAFKIIFAFLVSIPFVTSGFSLPYLL